MNVRGWVKWGVSVVLFLVFAAAGSGKVYDPNGTMAANFHGWGLSTQIMQLVGVVEVGGAILLMLPRVALAGATGLVVVMVGAVVVHAFNFETLGLPLLPLSVTAGLALVVWLRVQERRTLSGDRIAREGT